MQCRSQEVVEGFEDMEDVVKFIFGISGESVACSSSCVGIYIFGDFLVGFHLQSSVFYFVSGNVIALFLFLSPV